MDIWPHPCTRTAGGHESYNFGRPFLSIYIVRLIDAWEKRGKNAFSLYGRHFLGHHCYILNLPYQCLGVEKKIFKEIMHFHLWTYMAIP